MSASGKVYKADFRLRDGYGWARYRNLLVAFCTKEGGRGAIERFAREGIFDLQTENMRCAELARSNIVSMDKLDPNEYPRFVNDPEIGGIIFFLTADRVGNYVLCEDRIAAPDRLLEALCLGGGKTLAEIARYGLVAAEIEHSELSEHITPRFGYSPRRNHDPDFQHSEIVILRDETEEMSVTDLHTTRQIACDDWMSGRITGAEMAVIVTLIDRATAANDSHMDLEEEIELQRDALRAKYGDNFVTPEDRQTICPSIEDLTEPASENDEEFLDEEPEEEDTTKNGDDEGEQTVDGMLSQVVRETDPVPAGPEPVTGMIDSERRKGRTGN